MLRLGDVPDWVVASAHRRADETGVEHAVIFRISVAPFSGDVGGSFSAVPLGSITDEEWMASPYVAIPNELD